MRSLLRPLFDELGFAAAPGDSDDRRRCARPSSTALGTIGNDRTS